MSKFQNWLYYSSKNDNCVKQMSIPPFLGDVGMKKWSPFLDSGARSPIFGHLKTRTFGKSAYFWVLENGGIDIRFIYLSLLDEL